MQQGDTVAISMIRLGLERITRLLEGKTWSWRAVHVAGTNGKGSICAYLSFMFYKHRIRAGRFTSPHLIDRWDCITIDEKPVAESIFREVEAQVKRRDLEKSIAATEFELLTATAFEIFEREKVEVAVVECGVGGRTDATNVIEKPLATVIASIGLDHQGLLGDIYAEIAAQKAGILKPDVACVLDGTSPPEAVAAVQQEAGRLGVEVLSVTQEDATGLDSNSSQSLSAPEKINLLCAVHAFSAARQARGDEKPDLSTFLDELVQVKLPGRFQTVQIKDIVGRPCRAILDGAHNTEAWRKLIERVARIAKPGSSDCVTWVIACSRGKSPAEMFSDIPLSDAIVLTEFGPVDGMPWVSAMPANEIMPSRRNLPESNTVIEAQPLKALQRAAALANGGLLVIAGSLYLVSDVHRLLRELRSQDS